VTVSTDPITLPERVLIYAAGELAGATYVEVAEAIGISERMVYNDRRDYADDIRRAREIMAPVIRVNRREIRHIERAAIMKELEARIGMSFDTLDRAMASGGELAYNAGKEVRDRMIGKPASTHNVHGSVAHQIAGNLQVILPEEARASLRVGISQDLDLLRTASNLLRGETTVITVEPTDAATD
jgi:hypothetical protein